MAGKKKNIEAEVTEVVPAAVTTEVKEEVKEEKKAEKKAASKKTTAKKTAAKKAKEEKPAVDAKEAKKTAKKTARKKTAEKTEEVKAAAVKETEEKVVEAPEKDAEAKTEAESAEPKKAARKTAAKKTAAKKTTTKKTTAKKTTKKSTAKAEEASVEGASVEVAEAAVEEAPVEVAEATVEEAPVEAAEAAVEEAPVEAAEATVEEAPVEVVEETPVYEEAPVYEAPVYVDHGPRRSIAFIGSECHPFVKTGGLGDVMYALPRALVNMNCDVRVILPRYECIPWQYQEKMVYRGEFYMDLGETDHPWYVGIMEYVWDGVVYDFIDNQDFFSGSKPYTNLVDDIPKYCYFSKAALAALNYMNWIPDIIHVHDWQAALVPVYLRTLFADTALARAKTIITIHNLKFQGTYNIETIKYWTGLPDYVFEMDALAEKWLDANMMKGGLTYADRITTVSRTYAHEIQTEEYGENLDAHLRYHGHKLSGIVNGIDVEMWNPYTDSALAVNYDITNVLERKPANKNALQRELGLYEDDGKFVIGLISRLTDQKGLDLVNAIIPQIMDEHTQVVILGTGDPQYEDSFRYFENAYRGNFAACIQYDESRAHRIYAGADALLVPSRFEPCGLTQLNAMHYGTIPIVRETGGLKDTVAPYDMNNNGGNGFTFDRYDAGLLLDAINRAKTFYFTNRWCWDEMVQRDMDKDVSWENSARQYKDMYLELTQW